jgi:glutamine amidotransferase-like uncharacterized protein
MLTGATNSPIQTQQSMEGVNVSVYSGPDTLGNSVIALDSMFTWMNASTDYVGPADILEGILNESDILVMPGGPSGSYQLSLGTDGMEIVRQFVRNGGSYFGICGGSQFATRYGLSLFNGSLRSAYVEGPGVTFLTNMTIHRNSTGPDLSEENETCITLYWGSSYFDAVDMSNIITIASYPSNNEPGMIAFQYGRGTVFLSSPHPEYEEGSDRDGTDAFDHLEDPDSEWGLLLKVSQWLIEASNETLPDDVPGNGLGFDMVSISLLALGSVGVILIVVVIIKKRS